jgi:hypothetical protein
VRASGLRAQEMLFLKKGLALPVRIIARKGQPGTVRQGKPLLCRSDRRLQGIRIGCPQSR